MAARTGKAASGHNRTVGSALTGGAACPVCTRCSVSGSQLAIAMLAASTASATLPSVAAEASVRSEGSQCHRRGKHETGRCGDRDVASVTAIAAVPAVTAAAAFASRASTGRRLAATAAAAFATIAASSSGSAIAASTANAA